MNKKSEENIYAAEVLISGGCYNSSVHCSYYALFQHMKYILNSQDFCSYAKQDEKTNTKGSHNTILAELRSHIEDVALSRNVRDFSQLLKKKRAVADYEITQIEQGEAKEELHRVRNMITELNQYFNI